MKNLLNKRVRVITTIIILLCAACQSNQKNNHPTKDYIILSGHIANSKGGTISLINTNSNKRWEIQVEESGDFLDTLRSHHLNSNTYLFTFDNLFTRLYLVRGKSLNMNFDSNNFKKSIVFSGETGPENQYFLKKTAKRQQLNGDLNTTYKLAFPNFKREMQNTEQTLSHIVDTTSLPKSFKELEKKNIHFEYLTALQSYFQLQRRKEHRSIEVFESKFWQNNRVLRPTNSTEFLFSDSYRQLVKTSINNKIDSLNSRQNNKPHHSDIAYLKLVSNIKNDTIRNSLLYDKAKTEMGYSKKLDDFYTLFKKYSTHTDNNKEIAKEYKQLKKLTPGSPSPEFIGYKNYDGGTTSLKDLLGNEYLYLDIWATWCGPCVAELPYLKKIEKKYKGSNIKFVSISIDQSKDENKWRKFIEARKLGGTQLIADSDWKSDFIQKYRIKGIPRFIIIDPEGNIIDSNAPRPSDPALEKTLAKLHL